MVLVTVAVTVTETVLEAMFVAAAVVMTVPEPRCETRTVIFHVSATVGQAALPTALQPGALPVTGLAPVTAAVTLSVTALLIAVVSPQLLLLLMELTGWELVQ